MNDCTVLMTGCGAPGAPGIIRCLRRNGERNIRIVAVDRNENAGARDLVDAFYTVPSAEKENFIPAVLDVCRREGVQVVIPIVTRELMKFARARSEFESLGIRVSVMEPEALEIVNNKAHLLDAMRSHGLRTPEYRHAHTVEELKAACAALGYPERALCVKAAVGNGSRGIRMLDPHISRFDLFFEQKPNSMFISYEDHAGNARYGISPRHGIQRGLPRRPRNAALHRFAPRSFGRHEQHDVARRGR